MFIKKFLLLIPFILLTGCGHSFVTVDKGIGVHLKVPLPNGQPIVDLKLGYIDSTTTVIRGNTSVEASTATGGNGLSLGAGTSQTVLVTSGPQVNEGYVAQILTNPNTDQETKQALTQYLIKAQPPKLKPTALTVANGGVATGENSLKPKSVKSGFDNVVDKIAQSYDTTVESTQQGVENVSNRAMKYIYAICVLALITVIIIVFFIIRYFQKKKNI